MDPQRPEENWWPEMEEIARTQNVVPVLGDFKGIVIQGSCKGS